MLPFIIHLADAVVGVDFLSRTAVIVLSVSILVLALVPLVTDGYPGGVSSSNQEYDCGGSCHTEPSTATITMWASNQTVAPGGAVDVIVNVSGGQAVSILGVMIVSVRSPVLTSIPTEEGWIIRSDPAGDTFNYHEVANYTGSVSMRWQLNAPTTNGSYSLYARTMHGGGDTYAVDDTGGLTFEVTTTPPAPIPEFGMMPIAVITLVAAIILAGERTRRKLL